MLTKANKIVRDMNQKNIGIIDVFKIKPLNKKIIKDLSKYKKYYLLRGTQRKWWSRNPNFKFKFYK